MELLWAAVGWVAGFGLNLIAHELPRSQRLLALPCCVGCEARLPLRSFTVLRPGLRANCAACAAPVLDLVHTLEWPAALIFGILAWCLGVGLPLLVVSAYTLVLLLVLAIDLRHRWVYTVICYPAILASLLLTPLLSGEWWSGLLGAAVGGGLFFLLYWIGRVAYRGEAMGIGDITIGTMIGAMVGAERVVLALFLGGVLVAAVSIVLLVLRRASVRDFIPYGAGLCLGALLTLITACPAAA